MQLSSLDITLRRINMIENQFQSLVSYAQKPDADFQKILDTKVQNSQNPTKTSRSEINDLISKYADKNGLDEDFVKAVINQESGFNPNATSHCGAMGLMQLMPSTAQGLGVTNAYDAEQNIEGGTKYLKGLMDRFGNDKSLALAEPNDILPHNLSKSYTSYKSFLSSSANINSSSNLVTILYLSFILDISTNGFSIKYFNFLLPIAVLVLSKSHNNEYVLSLVLKHSVNSKFLLV